jgi:hypothetical protein
MPYPLLGFRRETRSGRRGDSEAGEVEVVGLGLTKVPTNLPQSQPPKVLFTHNNDRNREK